MIKKTPIQDVMAIGDPQEKINALLSLLLVMEKTKNEAIDEIRSGQIS